MKVIFNKTKPENDILTVLNLTANASEAYICSDEELEDNSYYTICGTIKYFNSMSEVILSHSYLKNKIYYVQKYNDRFFKVINNYNCADDNYAKFLENKLSYATPSLQSFFNIPDIIKFFKLGGGMEKILIELFKYDIKDLLLLDMFRKYSTTISSDFYYFLIMYIIRNSNHNSYREIGFKTIEEYVTKYIKNNAFRSRLYDGTVDDMIYTILNEYCRKYIMNCDFKSFRYLISYYYKYEPDSYYEKLLLCFIDNYSLTLSEILSYCEYNELSINVKEKLLPLIKSYNPDLRTINIFCNRYGFNVDSFNLNWYAKLKLKYFK